jgi:hypothetical protein
MSCTITHELSVSGNLLVLTKKEGTRTVATDKMLISDAIVYIDYPNELLRIDSLNEMHNKTHFTLAGATTYSGLTGYTGQGDISPVTLPCGTTYTPTQAFADLILFAQSGFQTTYTSPATTGTITSFGANWSGTLEWKKDGDFVEIWGKIDAAGAASHIFLAAGGLPVALRPANRNLLLPGLLFYDDTASDWYTVALEINTNGSMGSLSANGVTPSPNTNDWFQFHVRYNVATAA